MSGIFRKCPFCGEDAVLSSVEPDFRKGVFRRIFRCRNEHEISEEVSFDEERKWVKGVFEKISNDLRNLSD